MNSSRSLSTSAGNTLAAFVTNALPMSERNNGNHSNENGNKNNKHKKTSPSNHSSNSEVSLVIDKKIQNKVIHFNFLHRIIVTVNVICTVVCN